MTDQETTCNELTALLQIDADEANVSENSTAEEIENRKRKAESQQRTPDEKHVRKTKCRKLFNEMNTPKAKRRIYKDWKPLHDLYIKNSSDFVGFRREYLKFKKSKKRIIDAMNDPESEEGRVLLKEKEQRKSWNEMYWEAKEKIPQAYQPTVNLFVKLNVNGISTVAFIDSGASCSFIDFTFAQKCGMDDRIDKRNIAVMQGLGGSELMIGTIYLCCVEIAQTSFDAKFNVWNDNFDVTIGIDFMRYNRCSIDMARHRLCFAENVYAEFLTEAEVEKMPLKRDNSPYHSFEVDDQKLTELIEMGFSKEDSVNALKKYVNDLARAVDSLYCKAEAPLIKAHEEIKTSGEEKTSAETSSYVKNKIEATENNSISDIEHVFTQEEKRIEACDKLYYQAKTKIPQYFLPVSNVLIKAAVNGISTIALIDTGAGKSLMDYSFAEKCGLEHKIDKRQRANVCGIAGSVEQIGTIFYKNVFTQYFDVCSGSLEISGTEFHTRFNVANSSNVLIIGLDFLRLHKWHIDLPKNRLYFNEEQYVELVSENAIEEKVRISSGVAENSIKNDSEKLSKLICLGFNKDVAANALMIYNNDLQCALRFLYKGII